MDERYPSDSYVFTEAQKSLISKWIQDTIQHGIGGKDVDLRVDEICAAGYCKDSWLRLSLSLAYQASVILHELDISSIIGIVVIPLYADEKEKMGFSFQNLEDIKSEFDGHPPSLYLYPLFWRYFVNFSKGVEKIGIIFIDGKLFKILFYEKIFWLEGDLQHIRGIILVPHPYRDHLKETLRLN